MAFTKPEPRPDQIPALGEQDLYIHLALVVDIGAMLGRQQHVTGKQLQLLDRLPAPLNTYLNVRHVVLQHPGGNGAIQHQGSGGDFSAFISHEVIPRKLAELESGTFPTDGDLGGC